MKYPNPTFFWKLITRPFQICQIYKGSASLSFVKTPLKFKRLISFNLNFAFFHVFHVFPDYFLCFTHFMLSNMSVLYIKLKTLYNFFFSLCICIIICQEFCINISKIVCLYLILLRFIVTLDCWGHLYLKVDLVTKLFFFHMKQVIIFIFSCF